MRTVRIVTDDIGMKFVWDKCAVLDIKCKKVESDGIDLPDASQLRALRDRSYKYLAVLESDGVLYQKCKERLRDEYTRWVKKCLKTKLNGGNMVRAIKTWAVSLVRYSAGIVEWTQEELDQLDKKTRKSMCMNRMLHPRVNVSRLYLPRVEGDRVLLQCYSYSAMSTPPQRG